MKNPMSSDLKVVPISASDANQFIDNNLAVGEQLVKGKVFNLSLQKNGAVQSIAQFGLPIEPENKKNYTYELVLLAFTENSKPSAKEVNLLVNKFISRHDPEDFFVNERLIGKNNIFSTEKEKFKRRKTESGGSLLEWVNPNRTFYTYKITAADSDKYYYGVSHVKKANATVEECINDGYYGSGGSSETNNKFYNWKKKHNNSLEKEVIKIFSRKSEAYAHEKELVGDLYKTDKLCLNSTTGGKQGGVRALNSQASRTVKICAANKDHGESAHQGDACLKCSSAKRFFLANCSEHGEVKHTKKGCVSCRNSKFEMKTCETHGKTKFRSNGCIKCNNEKNISVRVCVKHGETKFIGSMCFKCRATGLAMRFCETHGETMFRNEGCIKCTSEKLHQKRNCIEHGITVHKGSLCMNCQNEKAVTEQECIEHGLTKFQGESCGKCNSVKSKVYSKRHCEVCEEETSHRKDDCIACINRKNVAMEECEKHGLVKHQKGRCCSCVAEKGIHTREHVKKGKQSDSCYYCLAIAAIV